MSLSRLQIPYMTTAERMAIVPNDKDVLLDTDEMIIYVGDGSTTGGVNACRQDLSELQEKLVSGENIKTLNNQSLLGEGNITITASATTDNTTITGTGTVEDPFKISDEMQRRINAGI